MSRVRRESIRVRRIVEVISLQSLHRAGPANPLASSAKGENMRRLVSGREQPHLFLARLMRPSLPSFSTRLETPATFPLSSHYCEPVYRGTTFFKTLTFRRFLAYETAISRFSEVFKLKPGVSNRCVLGSGELTSDCCSPSVLSSATTPDEAPQARCSSLGDFLAIVIVLQQRLVKSTLELPVLIAEILEHHADMKETHRKKHRNVESPTLAVPVANRRCLSPM